MHASDVCKIWRESLLYKKMGSAGQMSTNECKLLEQIYRHASKHTPTEASPRLKREESLKKNADIVGAFA